MFTLGLNSILQACNAGDASVRNGGGTSGNDSAGSESDTVSQKIVRVLFSINISLDIL
jgi:hypothetical protein